jgi:nucleosome assembly protein 1-like 1
LQKEQEEVERKFRDSYKPFIEEINAIISGKHTFTDADFQEIGELLTEQEQETKHNYFTNEKIPEFWLKVFMNSDVIGEHVEEKDEAILRCLEKVEGGKSEDHKKIWVDFFFSENEWFTNTQIHKEFELDEDVIKKSSGDQIQWKEGKNITIKIVKKKNKKKGGEKKTKEVKEKSFFNFFLDIEIDSDEEEEEEENQDVEDLEAQYEIAQALYEDIIPKSLEYYLGLIETMDDL